MITPPMPQTAPPAPAQGGGIPPELIALVTQILGRPPQSPDEVMMVLQMLQSQGGGAPGGAPGGTPQGGMAPGNAALMAAMGGR